MRLDNDEGKPVDPVGVCGKQILFEALDVDIADESIAAVDRSDSIIDGDDVDSSTSPLYLRGAGLHIFADCSLPPITPQGGLDYRVVRSPSQVATQESEVCRKRLNGDNFRFGPLAREP